VTAAALAERPRPVDATSRARQLDSRSGGGRLTLEQLLEGVWEGLQADGAAECPVCHGRMAPKASGGECGGCGSTLA
jgi:DnaJ-class molecular chaperone